jgi:lipid II:glycine glycyltransferase (peptidoglycan interpeptide bridge formation enzyme)
LGELWCVVRQNLARKYDVHPVHSLEELTMLKERFPELIQVRCALIDGVVIAGVVFFNAARVWHAQYIAASEVAYEVSALDAVFDAAIIEAQQAGARYFDFGTSNQDGGKVLNDGLYRFKSEFGGGGVAHEFYELEF